MSVHKNDRKPNPLQALTEAKVLVNYTLDMTENTKLFNKGLRYGITQQITNVCYDIIRHIESANIIYVNSPETALDREQEQRNAIKDLATLHSFMTIAKERYHLPSDKIYKWSTQYEIAGSYLGAWYKKEKVKNRVKYPFLEIPIGKMIYVSEQTSIEDVRKALEKLEEDADNDIINAVIAKDKLNDISISFGLTGNSSKIILIKESSLNFFTLTSLYLIRIL